MSKANFLIIALFTAASLLRLADVFRPIDKASWRECDLGSISRNFVQEGMNPLYPRIDWRGDGPGYAEMELPLYPYLTAVTYKIFGVHDQIGRIWSFHFSLGSLFFFFKLAREYLDIYASSVAFAFFAFNPLVFETSTSIQPEGLMLFAYIASVYFFVQWLKTDRDRDFWLAVITTALTILAKAPSAHIGLFFGVLLIGKFGWSAFKQAKIWLFVILTLLPGALWYLHAKSLWTSYGNSLGVSNEYHWIGRDFFTDPSFVTGILRIEVVSVWAVFGMFVAAFAFWRGYREQLAKHTLIWLASAVTIYILAARTTSEDWASYYHVFSVPPVALIVGLGVRMLWAFTRELANKYSQNSPAAIVAKVCIVFIVLAAIASSLLFEAKTVRANFLDHRVEDPSYTFAQRLRPLLKHNGSILVSGGHCVDPKGYPVAYNASFMFYWLDQKGWNICVEAQAVEKTHEYSRRGAKYFVAQKSFLQEKPGFEDELRIAYQLIAESDEFAVFDLTEGK